MVSTNRDLQIASEAQPEQDAEANARRLGSIVRTLRERRRLRQKDLARLARVAPNTVQGLEAGRRTQPAQLERIASALGTTPEALRRGEFQDAETLFRELTAEAIDVALLFNTAPTAVRTAVVAMLRTGRSAFGERLARLDPERQASVLTVLRAEEHDQSVADAADRERYQEPTSIRQGS